MSKPMVQLACFVGVNGAQVLEHFLSELANQTGQSGNGMGHFEGIVPQNFQTWTFRKWYVLLEEF